MQLQWNMCCLAMVQVYQPALFVMVSYTVLPPLPPPPPPSPPPPRPSPPPPSSYRTNLEITTTKQPEGCACSLTKLVYGRGFDTGAEHACSLGYQAFSMQ